MGDNRGASSVVGVILVVAVAVIIAATVAVLALGLVEDGDPPPQHVIEYEPYDDGHGVVHGRHSEGENLDPEKLQGIRGGAVDQDLAGADRIAGVAYTAYARPGDTVQLVWEDEGRTFPVSTYSVPDDTSLGYLNWSATGSTPVHGFRSRFLENCEVWQTGCGLEWDADSNAISVTDSGSLGAYTRTVPENDGNITVDLHLETSGLGDSGYSITLRDQSGDRYELWCEGSKPGQDGIRTFCNSGTSINGTDSMTISADEEIGALEIFVDMEDPSDEVRLFDLELRDT
jgi:flagellin-like protein